MWFSNGVVLQFFIFKSYTVMWLKPRIKKNTEVMNPSPTGTTPTPLGNVITGRIFSIHFIYQY